MGEYELLIATLALMFGASWASGINLYATVAVLGIGGATGHIALPEQLDVLTRPLVIGVACTMYCIEFLADKIPGLDSLWDALHTFIRIPAGAALAAGAVGDVSPALAIAAGLAGGSVTAATHGAKAGTRAIINTSPEPVSNWTASLAEDAAVFAGLWTALSQPWVFLVLLAAFSLLLCWLLPRIWRGVRAVGRRVRSWFVPGDRRHRDASAPRPVGGSETPPH